MLLGRLDDDGAAGGGPNPPGHAGGPNAGLPDGAGTPVPKPPLNKAVGDAPTDHPGGKDCDP